MHCAVGSWYKVKKIIRLLVPSEPQSILINIHMKKHTLNVKYNKKNDSNIVTLFVQLIFAQFKELHDFFMSFENIWKQ